MKMVYLLVYSDSLGTRDELKSCLEAIPGSLWRYDMPHSFYLLSDKSAQELSDIIRKRMNKNGRFLITQLASNRQGWITPDSWYLINNLQPKPKS
jgi:hypothetical protein